MDSPAWFDRIRERYSERLTTSEIRKGVAALSRIYVEERRRMDAGAVFEGAGKRAAFACFYSPLHFLAIRAIVSSLGVHRPPPRRIFDLGCGLGVAGVAWAQLCETTPEIVGFERSGWASAEARWLLAELGLPGRVHQKSLMEAPRAGPGEAIVAAYAVNELDSDGKRELLARLLDSIRRGASVLVVEPIALRRSPWWLDWREEFLEASGRADEWRFPVDLPAPLALLDRASGLDHRELTARSLYAGGAASGAR
ncbi:MAG TPA: class I SAM-dependent methyltransferase [Vicinamibacteria bacterium]